MTTEPGSTIDHGHRSADRNAFSALSDEAKAGFDQRLGEVMEQFDETINDFRSNVAATHGDHLDILMAKYGPAAVRHYREQTKSHCLHVRLTDLL
jgi:hypothetical protein